MLTEVGSITSKLKELENQKELILEEINKVEKGIDLIKNSNIKKSDLKEIFKDIEKYYNLASAEEQKYMIKTIIRGIKIRLKKNEEKGEIDIHFQGDGLIKKEWVNKTVNPEKLVSSYYLDWLHKIKSIRTFFSGNKELYTYKYCLKMLAGK